MYMSVCVCVGASVNSVMYSKPEITIFSIPIDYVH